MEIDQASPDAKSLADLCDRAFREGEPLEDIVVPSPDEITRNNLVIDVRYGHAHRVTLTRSAARAANPDATRDLKPVEVENVLRIFCRIVRAPTGAFDRLQIDAFGSTSVRIAFVGNRVEAAALEPILLAHGIPVPLDDRP